MKPTKFYIEEVLHAANQFLKSNENLKEPVQEFWVDHEGNLRKVPAGMYFDAKGDSLKFKKGR